MNGVRFYETLAKIIGEREGVEITVKVREVSQIATNDIEVRSVRDDIPESTMREVQSLLLDQVS